MPAAAVVAAVQRLASRNTARTEADIQADAYLVLVSGDLALESGDVVRLEEQVEDGTRRRLDIAVGNCVIEVKKDLRPGGILSDAQDQLAGYVGTQSKQLGTRYVGILTDGTLWYLYRLDNEKLVRVAELLLPEQAPDVDRLLVWLESILATQEKVAPAPAEIQRSPHPLPLTNPTHHPKTQVTINCRSF